VTFLALGLAMQSGNYVQADQPGTYTAYGLTMSCGAWSAEGPLRTSIKADEQLWWLLGFMTGAGSALSATPGHVHLAQTDSKGIVAWITKRCAERPLDEVTTAATDLVVELMARGQADSRQQPRNQNK
jgi:hypothetical protein